MRILAILLFASFYPGVASSQEWCHEPICARFEGSDAIRILAPGRFEITFTKAQGFGGEIHDLEADPDKLYTLSGPGQVDSNGILWTKVVGLGNDDGSYYANYATDLELLEPGGVRVRASHAGKHHRYGMPGIPWNDLGYVQTFTVYATGEVYVDYTLLASTDIPLWGFTLIIKSTGDWGEAVGATAPGEAHCIGEYGLDRPYASTASSFAMVSSNGSRYYADVLMAMYDGIYGGSYWNEGALAEDFRCGLAIADMFPNFTVPTGTTHLPILMRIAQDMNDAASATKYADAFRNPDAALAVIQGVKIVTDPGDRDGDGFNEEDGTYVLQRQGSQDVEFVLHADRPRLNSAFKILDWDEARPQSIWVNDALWLEGTQFRASLIGPDLILQLLGERTQDTRILVRADNCPSQADRDLDGIGDACDLCPDYATANNSDINSNGIGDPCECGDQTQDGKVNVLDILGINLTIFGQVQVSPLCDTNNDGLCNVQDIIGANSKIFGRPAYCSRYPPPGP